MEEKQNKARLPEMRFVVSLRKSEIISSSVLMTLLRK